MTQHQLESAVAEATGEPIRLIHDLGFSLLTLMPGDLESQDESEVVICPRCREPVPHPGNVGDGSPAMGECRDCDIFFAVEAPPSPRSA